MFAVMMNLFAIYFFDKLCDNSLNRGGRIGQLLAKPYFITSVAFCLMCFQSHKP